MTENEAIHILKEKCIDIEYYFAEHDRYMNEGDAELQEAINIASKALKEIQKYQTIGTVEECQEAKEKRMAKKPILDSMYKINYYCPNCEDFLTGISRKKFQYCQYCGQAISWENINEADG